MSNEVGASVHLCDQTDGSAPHHPMSSGIREKPHHTKFPTGDQLECTVTLRSKIFHMFERFKTHVARAIVSDEILLKGLLIGKDGALRKRLGGGLGKLASGSS